MTVPQTCIPSAEHHAKPQIGVEPQGVAQSATSGNWQQRQRLLMDTRRNCKIRNALICLIAHNFFHSNVQLKLPEDPPGCNATIEHANAKKMSNLDAAYV